jgi:type III secretion system HrpB2-like protein
MTAAISGIPPVESVLQAAHKGLESSAMERLTQKFDALVSAPHSSGHTTQPFTPQEPNAVAQVMDKQEAMMRQSFADMDNVAANMSLMSAHELEIAGMQISRGLALSNLGMQTTMGVAQGSSKSLQSLLKNQ